MALAIRELSEKHEQAEARVAELERENRDLRAEWNRGLKRYNVLREQEALSFARKEAAESERDRLRAALEEIANRNWVMHSRDDSEAFDAVVAFARRALSAGSEGCENLLGVPGDPLVNRTVDRLYGDEGSEK